MSDVVGFPEVMIANPLTWTTIGSSLLTGGLR